MFSRTYLLIAEERWKSATKLPLWRKFGRVKIAFVETLNGSFRLDLYFFKTLRPTVNELPPAGVKGSFLWQQPLNKCFVPPARRTSTLHRPSSAARGRAFIVLQSWTKTQVFIQIVSNFKKKNTHNNIIFSNKGMQLQLDYMLLFQRSTRTLTWWRQFTALYLMNSANWCQQPY